MSDSSSPYPPLPKHLYEPFRTERFVVLTYERGAGWWRRVSDWHDLPSAQKVADAYNDDGLPVMVCRQYVVQGGLEPITGASGGVPENEQYRKPENG